MNTEFKIDGMPPYPLGEPRFVELLKKHIPFVPHWDETSAPKNALDLTRGVCLQIDFPDPENLLTSAYGDFQRFLGECGLDGKAVITNDREGTFMHENRLGMGLFGPEKLRKIKL